MWHSYFWIKTMMKMTFLYSLFVHKSITFNVAWSVKADPSYLWTGVWTLPWFLFLPFWTNFIHVIYFGGKYYRIWNLNLNVRFSHFFHHWNYCMVFHTTLKLNIPWTMDLHWRRSHPLLRTTRVSGARCSHWQTRLGRESHGIPGLSHLYCLGPVQQMGYVHVNNGFKTNIKCWTDLFNRQNFIHYSCKYM